MTKLLIYFSLLLNVAYAAEPIKVAVIDTGLDLHDPRFATVLCPTGHADFTGEGLEDMDGHGTHVAGLIMQNAKDANYCLIILKFYPHKGQALGYENVAIERAVELGATFVNFSAGGKNMDEKENYLIKHNPQITFVVAAGNENENIDEVPYYPAAYPYKNVISVGCLTKGRIKCSFSNYGTKVKVWELGDHLLSFAPGSGKRYLGGTSMSTAVTTGKMVRNASN